MREVLRGAQALVGGRPDFDATTLVREVRLGLSDYAAHLLLPSLLAQLAREAPGVDLVIVDRASRDTVADLLERKAFDLAVTVGPVPSARIAVEPLFDDGWTFVARAGHPVWAGELAPASLAEWPALLVSPEGDRYGIADRLLGELGLKRRVALTLPQFLAAPAALATSDLVALLPARLADALAKLYGLRTAPPPFPQQPRFTMSLAWHRRDADDPAHTWLRRALHAAAQPRNGS